ncbi:MAG TPA: PAS domain-containing protein, partial [Inquilinus sp.]
NLFSLLHPDLRPAVRAALKRCAETGGRVTQGTFSLGVHGPLDLFNLIVEPLANPKGDDLFVVVFHSVGRARNETPDEGPASDGGDAAVQVLSAELLAAREELRNTRDELEAAHAESQSSNEEYLSITEELQSSNEELETAKEEMQSLNEELQTVNSELANRNEGLVRANSDLLNLLSSTSIATLFLDNDLRIRRFTPRVLDIFKVRDGDEGRPIGDIVSGLARDGPAQDVKQVLRTLMPIEREVAMTDGRTSYLMQVRPYRDLNDVIDGAVVTFVDITERKLHEQARSLLAAIVDSSEDAIMSHDLRGTIVSWNGGAERLFGRTADEAIGQAGSAFLRGTRTDDWSRVQAGLVDGDRIAHFDTFRTGKGGERIDMSCTVSPVKDGGGRVVGASVVARDITERRAAEQKNALLLGELDHRVKNILALVSAVISQTLRAGLTPEEFATAMHGRIQSIAKAHSLLTAAGHGDVSLRTLIESELAPYDRKGEARLTISGADVALTPKAGIPMAMAIHELASNAAKYGALSEAAGRLDVRWSTADGQDGESLVLSWVEAGGPRCTRRPGAALARP